jgi:hypothetical protein
MKISKSFTATGFGSALAPPPGSNFSYSVSGTFAGTWKLLRTFNNGVTYDVIDSGTGTKTGTVEVPPATGIKTNPKYLFQCSAYTSGTLVALLTQSASLPVGAKSLVIPAGVHSKVGATAGWVVGAANDTLLSTCPASQTAATLVVPVQGLKVGDTIIGFSLVGEIASSGGAVTLDASLKSLTTAVGSTTTAVVEAMTQIAATANTLVDPVDSLTIVTTDQPVTQDTTFFALLTATTAASTSIALQGVIVHYLPAA